MEQTEKVSGTRLNKYLSEKGICSRREADRLVQEHRVLINGTAAEIGTRIYPGDIVSVDGRPVTAEKEERVILLFFKPRGIVCSTRKQFDEVTVTEYLHYPVRIYPAGRLDKDSEGLLLMTNQGDLVNQIMRAKNHHEKEYIVTVDRPVNDEFIRKMSSGIPILDTVTRPCTVEKIGRNRFRIVLTQGLNRQIRRMCEYLGFHVTSLRRIRIMNLRLDTLRPGEYRSITKKEYAELLSLLKNGELERRKPGGTAVS